MLNSLLIIVAQALTCLCSTTKEILAHSRLKILKYCLVNDMFIKRADSKLYEYLELRRNVVSKCAMNPSTSALGFSHFF